MLDWREYVRELVIIAAFSVLWVTGFVATVLVSAYVLRAFGG